MTAHSHHYKKEFTHPVLEGNEEDAEFVEAYRAAVPEPMDLHTLQQRIDAGEGGDEGEGRGRERGREPMDLHTLQQRIDAGEGGDEGRGGEGGKRRGRGQQRRGKGRGGEGGRRVSSRERSERAGEMRCQRRCFVRARDSPPRRAGAYSTDRAGCEEFVRQLRLVGSNCVAFQQSLPEDKRNESYVELGEGWLAHVAKHVAGLWDRVVAAAAAPPQRGRSGSARRR